MLTKSTIAPFVLRCLGVAALGGALNCSSSIPDIQAPSSDLGTAMDSARPDLDAPDLYPTDTTRYMFVTSRMYGLTDITVNADMKMTPLNVLDDECRTLADNGGIHRKRKFRAWFSTDGSNDPATRFTAARLHPKVAYVLPNGRQVAASWDALTSLGGSINYQLTHAINVTESGEVLDCEGVLRQYASGEPTSTNVWTNVQPNGVSAMQPTCVGAPQMTPDADAGSVPASISVTVGDYCARDANWTQTVDGQNDPLPQMVTCGPPTAFPIYCIEDEVDDQ